LREFIKPLIESKQKSKLEHLYAVAPERVDPGNVDWNLENTPRLVSGIGDEATSRVKEFYSQFCGQVIEVTSPEVAEAAKLFENTFRQVNIALVNELAKVTNKLGISVYETLNAADTKPYGFLKFNPGLGVGGHCIPIDPSYLADTASKLGIETKFINLANKTNLEMPNYIVSRIESDLGKTLKNKKVLILGAAYKPNVADTRETPSKLLINELRRRGADVCWHDPLVEDWNGEVSSNLQEVDAIIIAQMHDQFLKVKLESYSDYIFDCTGRYATPNSL
jgi:UDP-N-acetyl-D-glucosamine dehydrogenase